ncbi:MAG TPA: isoprenyl transferase [Alphaproteobacteria bacterium]|nr:isoprenyl transferase [Alphaproteobacteria bacterium]
MSDSTLRPPPAHIAIVMDGNGRWATSRALPRTAGHKKGVEAVRHTLEAARELGVAYLTLFGFSSENWRRPLEEVSALMQLLRLYLRSEIADIHRNGIRLRVIGDRSRLPEDIRPLIERAEALTAGNSAAHLTIALSYGGRAEIARAAKELAAAVKRGEMDWDDIDEDAVSRRLFTADIPDPDLIIRTSGEQRLSNFLLWQSAYSELYFTDTLWPDFSKSDLEDAIAEYRRRDRRYGAVASTR